MEVTPQSAIWTSSWAWAVAIVVRLDGSPDGADEAIAVATVAGPLRAEVSFELMGVDLARGGTIGESHRPLRPLLGVQSRSSGNSASVSSALGANDSSGSRFVGENVL